MIQISKQSAILTQVKRVYQKSRIQQSESFLKSIFDPNPTWQKILTQLLSWELFRNSVALILL